MKRSRASPTQYPLKSKNQGPGRALPTGGDTNGYTAVYSRFPGHLRRHHHRQRSHRLDHQMGPGGQEAKRRPAGPHRPGSIWTRTKTQFIEAITSVSK